MLPRQAALYYAKHCGWPVFPIHSVVDGRCTCGKQNCGASAKHPRIDGGVNAATTDLAQVEQWWLRWPGANIGVAIGMAGLMALDIDPRNGGDESLAALEAEYGPLPETIESCTGGGGRHLLYAAPPGALVASIARGVDVKGVGGYIVVPPSTHVSGSCYRWRPGHGPSAIRTRGVPEAPNWLQHYAARDWRPKRARRDEGRPGDDFARRGGAELRGMLQRAGWQLARGGESEWWTRPGKKSGCSATLWRGILYVFSTNATPFEANHSYNPLAVCALLEHRGDYHAAASALAARGYGNGDDVTIEAISAADVVVKDVRWLWPERFALGKLSLLVGDPDVGKSYLTLDMAARVSCGASWPERGAAPRGKVLLLSAEDSVQDTIRPRLEGVRADLSRVIVVSSVCRRKRAAHFNLATDLQALRRLVATDPEYRLVVIDPISAYMGDLDTNSNSLVRGALSPLAAWAAEAGVAVVCVSHLRKSEGAVVYRTMGSLAFTAAARAVWAVTRDSQDETGQRRVLWPVKNNLSVDRTSLAFCIVSDEGGSRGAYLRWETPQEEPFWKT